MKYYYDVWNNKDKTKVKYGYSKLIRILYKFQTLDFIHVCKTLERDQEITLEYDNMILHIKAC